MLSPGWGNEVLIFWFGEAGPGCWFNKDAAFDDTVRQRFRALHEALATCDDDFLIADPRTELAAVIVLDQMSRNLFRGTPGAFAADARTLLIAQEAIARGFDAGLTKDERMFLYLPFEHAEDAAAQARCVTSMATLDDPKLTEWEHAVPGVTSGNEFTFTAPPSSAAREKMTKVDLAWNGVHATSLSGHAQRINRNQIHQRSKR
jgi:uncharacterized protein (DUF924 family)